MDKTEREAIRARGETATPGPWEYFFKQKYDEHQVSVPDEGNMRLALFTYGCPTGKADAEFIAHARQDIPALDEADKLWKQVMEGSIYWQKAFDEMKDDRDCWKARAEALERAIKTIDEEDEDSCSIRCYFCINYGNCTDCTNYTKWEFDEARFAEEAVNENSD